MRHALPCLLVLAAPLAAQAYYIPDNQSNLGTCNAIPFGSSTATGSFRSCLTQQIYTAAELGSAPGVITGLEFAPCGTGRSRFDRLEVVLDLLPAGSTLSATFANNLTPNATTVLSTTGYVWQTTANLWEEIGLQAPFVYDGTSDLVVQILAENSTSPAGFHRSSTHRRVYATGWVGTPPATGTLSATTAQKIGITMAVARASLYGEGCQGSSGLRPHMALAGTPQLGSTQNLDLTQGPANGVAFVLAGFGNGAPYPLDLASFGLPGCYQYFTPVATQLGLTDAAGAAAFALSVTNDPNLLGVLLYAQWACLDAGANAGGVTTSDYARVLIGT